MKRLLISIFASICVWASVVNAQVGQIWVAPVLEYSQAGKYVDFSVQCSSDLIGLKGIHLDLDLDPVVASVVVDSIKLGDMFVDNDSVTFFYQYVLGDSTRLTIDIAVLEDSATVSGPGNLLHFSMFTKTFGEIDIEFAGLEVRDRFNQPILVSSLDGYLKVCQFVGDVNADNSIDIADLTYLVNWSFKGGPPPTPLAAGDADCNSSSDIADITALVRYMFLNGALCGPCVE